MKLHRLILANYRGITHREIEFPDHGVVVVCGANEIGKSSMIEAVDLLLECKDRSTKKEVKRVKPTNADVGSEVTAEISSGPYHFVYRKRFHRKCETELTVLAPRREQLTGDEAHERVQAMLAETVDTELWHAQRVLQAGSTAAVDLSGCDALSRALDVAAANSAGDAALSGTEPLLIERIETEYARYFTRTGRPAGEWSAAISRLAAAEAAVTECAEAIAQVDDRVRRHADLTEQVAELAQQKVVEGSRLTAAQTAADQIAALTADAREAKLVAAAATATSTASAAARTARISLIAEIDTRAQSVAAVEVQAHEALDGQAAARADAEAGDLAAADAAGIRTAAQRRFEAARRILDQLADREETTRLATRLARIEAVENDRSQVCAELSTIVVTEDVLRRIENAEVAVDRIRGQLALISAAVEFTAAADIELATSREHVFLAAGQSWSMTVTDPTVVEVPGVLTTRVTPGATALDLQAKHVAAQQELAAALKAGAVADLSTARRADRRRRELERSRDQLTATLAGLCGDEQEDELRSRLTQLRAERVGQPALFTNSKADAREELEVAEAALRVAEQKYEAQVQSAATAGRGLAEASTRATVLQNDVSTQRAEFDAAKTRLARERALVSDEDLACSADADLLAAQSAECRVAELAEALAGAAPAAVAAELAAAIEAAEAVRDRHDAAICALREVSAELSVLGSEGRKSKLDIAETECEHAASQHGRVGQRARAAQLLRSVMVRHRDATRLRYVEPYRAEVQRLGRPVFGPTFEVDIDSGLRIRSRTLNDITVAYESLSGGAKEQLGILARLAGAALVAKEDTVPVVVDDALGFTDPGRLAKMGEVFDTVGAHGQVIVLTCNPARYDAVKDAYRIDLAV
ncbi:AAA family ATPase [Mycobacterium sp.]|uniref:AAA family ATPase n=1 Tax=Mycobacterium sp. TaxID=1785 RepID=UPI003BAAC67A